MNFQSQSIPPKAEINSMASLLKVETHSVDAAAIVSVCIKAVKGCALVVGSAVLTDHDFTEKQHEAIKKYVSKTSEPNEYDLQLWESTK